MNSSDESCANQRLRAAVRVQTKGGASIASSLADPVLVSGMALPAQATYSFAHAKHGEPFSGHMPITIALFFGDNPLASQNVALGEFALEGIPWAPAGPEIVQIKLAVDAEQLLRASLLDHRTQTYRLLGCIDLGSTPAPEIVPPRPPGSGVREFAAQMMEMVQNPKPRETGIPRRGDDVSQPIFIHFSQALFGTQRQIDVPHYETCRRCSGTGARPGTSAVHCQVCHGTGWKQDKQQSAEGPLIRAIPCPACNGDGWKTPDPCETCEGRTWVESVQRIEVKIPRFVESGTRVRLLGRGIPGRYGGPPGHLDLLVRVGDHPFFSRTGHQITVRLPVRAEFAKAGGQVRVPGIEANSSFLVSLPPGTRRGAQFQAFKGDDYSLTARLDTYRPSLLFLRPGTRKALQAIKTHLGDKDIEVPVDSRGDLASRADVRAPSPPTQPTDRDQNDAEFYARRAALYAEMRSVTRALADYDRAVELDPGRAEVFDRRSILYFSQGEPGRALADLNRALELDPSNAEYYHHRGLLYLTLQDSAKALADCRRSLELGPENDDVHYGLAQAYVFEGDLAKARVHFDMAVELAPDKAEYYYHRGMLCDAQDDVTQARADYDKALELDPDNTQVLLRRSALHQRQQDLTRALADVTRALELEPRNVEALSARAYVYLALKEFEKALDDINQVIKMRPKDARAYNNRGYIYLEQNDLQSALIDYSRAIGLDPALADAYNGRGKVYLKSSRYNQAVEDWTRSLSLQPGDPHVQLWLGQAYECLHQRYTAAATYQAILDSGKNPELCKEAETRLSALGIKSASQ